MASFVLQKELKFLSFWYMNAVIWGIHVIFLLSQVLITVVNLLIGHTQINVLVSCLNCSSLFMMKLLHVIISVLCAYVVMSTCHSNTERLECLEVRLFLPIVFEID